MVLFLPFQYLYAFFVSGLSAWDRISSMTLNRSHVRKHPFLVLNLRMKAYRFLSLNIILAVGFLWLYLIRKFPSIPGLLGAFIIMDRH